MLDFDSEDIDGMDNNVGEEQEQPPTGHWTPTSSHDVYMVDTPKEDDDEERKDATKGCPLEKQSKQRRKRRSKSCLGRNSDHINPAIEQGEPSPDQGNTENQTEQPNPVEDNSPDDITPDRHPEQQNAHQRLVATARSLKKQKQRLKAARDTLQIRWSKILNTAARYSDNRPSKSYPKRKLLPEFDEEASEPPQPNIKAATWSDRRPLYQHRVAYNTAHTTIATHARARTQRTAQQDPSMDHASAPQHTMQHNKHPNNAVHPATGVPHTPYVSPMRCWTTNF